MATFTRIGLLVCFTLALVETVHAQDKPVVGLIPKVQKPLKIDGKLADWDGAFVTPVHVGHPDFANRGGSSLPLGRREPVHRPEMPRPEAGPRRPGCPTLGRRCRRVLPGHPPGRQARGHAVRSRHACTCSGRRSPRPTSSPGWPCATCRRSRTSSCKGPRSPPRRRRGAGPPSSSCPGRTSRSSRRRPARSSASTANCAAATAARGWTARSSILARQRRLAVGLRAGATGGQDRAGGLQAAWAGHCCRWP